MCEVKGLIRLTKTVGTEDGSTPSPRSILNKGFDNMDFIKKNKGFLIFLFNFGFTLARFSDEKSLQWGIAFAIASIGCLATAPFWNRLHKKSEK